MSNRDIVIDLLSKLPEDASLEEIAREIELIAGIKTAREQARRRKDVPEEDARKSLSEKLQMMEALWDDLTRYPEAFESPEWRREILDERERRIASGEARFSGWEEAKTDIRKRVS